MVIGIEFMAFVCDAQSMFAIRQRRSTGTAVRKQCPGVRPLRLVLLLTACALAAPALSAQDHTADLLLALEKSHGQGIVRLDQGDYAPVIRGFHGSVTLTSADPLRPAVFTSLKLIESSGLTFDRLEFDTSGVHPGPYGAMNTVPFQILNSDHITLRRLNVHGAARGTLETDVSGVMVRSSHHIMLTDNDFHNLHFAIQHVNDDFLTVRNNEFHDLRDDGVRGGGSSDVLIEGNHCHSNHPDGAADVDHPDCIQFWTTNVETPSHDIVIKDNRYERGSGHATQFIFLGNENHIPYQRVTITGNSAIGSSWNGIRVSEGRDVDITENRLTSLCAPDEGKKLVSWIATGGIGRLDLERNSAGAFVELGGDTQVTEKNNMKTNCAP